MDSETKKCADCLKTVPLSDFYQIRGSGEERVRWEKICKGCKRQRRKSVNGEPQKQNGPPVEEAEAPAKKKGEVRIREEDGQVIYKEYLYPNGETLQLTEEEFYRVVEVFRMLWEQDQKLNKTPAER